MRRLAAAVVYITASSALGAPINPFFFPQPRNPSDVLMEALIKGELVLVGQCLRLKRARGKSHFLIWPRELSIVV